MLVADRLVLTAEHVLAPAGVGAGAESESWAVVHMREDAPDAAFDTLPAASRPLLLVVDQAERRAGRILAGTVGVMSALRRSLRDVEYVLLYFVDEAAERPPEHYQDARDAIEEWVADVHRRGVLRAGGRLRPVAEGRTLKVRDGETFVVDGPFAETKEQVAGFDMIECASLDEAMEIAAGHPAARLGAVEIRPIWPLPE